MLKVIETNPENIRKEAGKIIAKTMTEMCNISILFNIDPRQILEEVLRRMEYLQEKQTEVNDQIKNKEVQ